MNSMRIFAFYGWNQMIYIHLLISWIEFLREQQNSFNMISKVHKNENKIKNKIKFILAQRETEIDFHIEVSFHQENRIKLSPLKIKTSDQSIVIP